MGRLASERAALFFESIYFVCLSRCCRCTRSAAERDAVGAAVAKVRVGARPTEGTEVRVHLRRVEGEVRWGGERDRELQSDW